MTMKLFLPVLPLASLAMVTILLLAAAIKADQMQPGTFFGSKDNQGYLDWHDMAGKEVYSNAVFLASADNNPSNGVAVHWEIVEDYLELAVAARAKGWLAFGFAEAGGMEGADMVIYEDANPGQLVDAHNLKDPSPINDDCNDWTFVDMKKTSDGFLIWEGRRLLDTSDSQDRIIAEDFNSDVAPHRVIAAWGDTPTRSYHNLNRARGAIRFFGAVNELALFRERMEQEATGSFVIRATDYPIKTQETDYVPFCVSKQDLLDQGVPDIEGLNVIGFEPFVDEDAVNFVHHFTVRGSLETNNDVVECIASEAQDTSNGRTPPLEIPSNLLAIPADATLTSYNQAFYGWAPGESPLLLPDDVGSPIFGANDMKSFQMVIHYNNPGGVSGALDSSGIRFYYTTEPKKHALGVLTMADALTFMRGQPVGEGLVEHTFTCPTTCSEQALDEPITVIREYIHMHKTGARAYTEHFRDGETIRGGNVDYFEFDQQGNHVFQQEPYTILPGDSFRTVCMYDSLKKDGTNLGLSSQEEMCISNLLYYPRKTLFNGRIPYACTYGVPIPGCTVEHESRILESHSEMKRLFGEAGEVCLADGVSPDIDGAFADDNESSAAKSMKLASIPLAVIVAWAATIFVSI